MIHLINQKRFRKDIPRLSSVFLKINSVNNRVYNPQISIVDGGTGSMKLLSRFRQKKLKNPLILFRKPTLTNARKAFDGERKIIKIPLKYFEFVRARIKIYVLCCTKHRLQEAKRIYGDIPCLIPILMKYQNQKY